MANEPRVLTPITLLPYKPIGNVYSYSELKKFLNDESVKDAFLVPVSSGKHLLYVNAPASFDIETTSFYAETDDEPEKVAIMYVWQLGINGVVIYGRTWQEFLNTINDIVSKFNLSSSHRLLIYCHNLSFEFQFIKEFFHWDKVFALKPRVPVYAIAGGIEFRCSYKLSNYSLEYLGNNLLKKYPVKKQVGDLDYSLIRHQNTVLTPTELNYAIYDVYVVMAYIRERMEEENNDISKIPLTNTGYVRRHCREKTLSSPRYEAMLRHLTVSGAEYNQLKRAFMGGFTHANSEHVNQILHNVSSYDIASDYPARIVLDYFPMSSARHIGTVSDLKQLKYYLDHYCCVFDFACCNIRPAVPYENILSVSRCKFLEGQRNYVANNGRLVGVDGWIRTTLTEIDYENLCYFYTWDYWEITNLRIYERAYLPTEFVSAVLDFYEAKTTLKGVNTRENEYGVAKNMLNSTYGMMVTDIVRDVNEFSETGWDVEHPNPDSAVKQYNNSRNRFLFYPWGIYVTAHARNQLFKMMLKLESDYIYSDTDSLKIFNYEEHKKIFEDYNKAILDKIWRSATYHGIPVSRYMPKDLFGKEHPIGFFEFEGTYDLFKTCGAKRYIYTQGDKTAITVAGLGKKAGLEYLMSTYGPELRQVYDAFCDGLYVPAGRSGKLTHTYIDKSKCGVITDYNGVRAFYSAPSGTHLEPASFCMSLLDSYLSYLYGFEQDLYFE